MGKHTKFIVEKQAHHSADHAIIWSWSRNHRQKI